MRELTMMSRRSKIDFADSLLKALDARPFGTPTKTELDGFLYDALVKAGYVEDTAPLFAAADRLQTTPSKVNGLRYSSRLRETDRSTRMRRMSEAIAVVLSSTKGDRVVLNVEDRFWRDLLEAELKGAGVYVDYSFNRERLVLESVTATDGLLGLFPDVGPRLRDDLQRARAAAKEQQFADVFRAAAKKAGMSAVGAAAGKVVAVSAVPLSMMLGWPIQ